MMRQCIFLTAILAISHCAGLPGVRAQTGCDIMWSAPVVVSTDSSLPTLPEISVSGGTVHLLWYGIDTTEDTRLTGSGVRYARRPAGSGSFSTPLTFLTAARSLPGYVASSGERVFVTSAAILDTFFGVVLFSSQDAGLTWSGPIPLLGNAYPELIYSTDSLVSIQYLDVQTGIRGMLRSTDAGTAWNVAATRVRELSDVSAVDDRLVAVGPAPGGSQTEAGFYVSVDGGVFWVGPEIISPEDVVRSASPRIAGIDGGSLFSAWIDTGAVILRSSRNGGISWGSWSRLSESPGNVSVDITADSAYVFVLWDRDISDSNGIRGRLSIDRGETYCPEIDPAGSPGAREPVASLRDSTVRIAWVDHSAASPGVFFREGALPGRGGIIETTPEEYALRQSYPNPTNGVAVIGFEVPEGTDVGLELYNVLGERVRVLVRGTYDAGRYAVPVDVSDLPSGVYLYRFTAAGFESMKKMIVLR